MGDTSNGHRTHRLDRPAMVALIGRIMAMDGTEEEIHSWLDLLDNQIPLPAGRTADLIFYPHRHGLDPEPDPERIVERMLAYRPFAL